MRRLAETIDKRANQQRIRERSNQTHSDISRIQIWHYQHIGAALQICLRINSIPQLRVKRTQHMHLAINLQIRVSLAQHIARAPHLLRRGIIGCAKV